jgi:hypothetical protein
MGAIIASPTVKGKETLSDEWKIIRYFMSYT